MWEKRRLVFRFELYPVVSREWFGVVCPIYIYNFRDALGECIACVICPLAILWDSLKLGVRDVVFFWGIMYVFTVMTGKWARARFYHIFRVVEFGHM